MAVKAVKTHLHFRAQVRLHWLIKLLIGTFSILMHHQTLAVKRDETLCSDKQALQFPDSQQWVTIESFGNCYDFYYEDPFDSYQNFFCTCATVPDGSWETVLETPIWIKGHRFITPCTICGPGEYTKYCEYGDPTCVTCEVGKFQSDADHYHDQCTPCADKTIAPNTAQSTCTHCADNQYSNDERTQCLPCASCAAFPNTELIGCNSGKEGTCVCSAGYYKPFASSECTPVPLGFFKNEASDSKGTECVQKKESLGFTTMNLGSTSEDACVCQQNYFLNDKNKCELCPAATPYNPVNGTGCRACYLYEHWTQEYNFTTQKMEMTCENITRMQLSFGNTHLSVDPGIDYYRTRNSQTQIYILPSNMYLDINTHEPKVCGSCPTFSERQACGRPQNGQLWLLWRDYNGIDRQNLVTLPLSNDANSCDFNTYCFWQQQQNNELTILREGKCVACVPCPAGNYQTQCIDGGTHTCQPCKTVCPNGNTYLAHPLSKYEDNQWKGGCELSYNTAQEDYTCEDCRRWKHENNQFHLLLACGNTVSDTRWEPTGNLSNGKPQEFTQVNTYPNYHASYQQEIPYCPQGWYVNPSADGCSLTTDEAAQVFTTPWQSDCCVPCGDESEFQQKKSSQYTPCTGSGTQNTQTYTDRCENGYYTKTVNGNEVCAQCTTC